MSEQINLSDMTKVSLADIKQMVLDAKDILEENAADHGTSLKVYFHWTAGHYRQVFADYHMSIIDDGGIYIPSEDLTITRNHTYYRNHGSIGIGICACVGAVSNDLGEEPPTDAQIESIAMITAVISEALGTEVTIENYMTHGEAADNLDGYDPGYPDHTGYEGNIYGPDSTCERWDLAILKNGDEWKSGGDIIRGKANWYLQEYKDGVENHF